MEKKILSMMLLGLLVGGTFYSTFVVTEGEQAIVVEFGKPVGNIVKKAGVHFRIPWMQEVRFFDKRILTWDGVPNQIPTKDKKYISVETTARWRIVDAVQFHKSVQDEKTAESRLAAIVDSATRDIISNYSLVEAVRNSNAVYDYVESLKKQEISPDQVEVVGEVEKIQLGREHLSALITKKADEELRRDCGIQIIDVQLKRIAYEKSVEKKVYERMISERERIAEQIRSVGEGQKAQIEGRLQKDLQTIQSEAYLKSKQLEGEAQEQAAQIYLKALGQNADFYDLVRSLEMYKKALNKNTELVITPDSELFKYFHSK